MERKASVLIGQVQCSPCLVVKMKKAAKNGAFQGKDVLEFVSIPRNHFLEGCFEKSSFVLGNAKYPFKSFLRGFFFQRGEAYGYLAASPVPERQA